MSKGTVSSLPILYHEEEDNSTVSYFVFLSFVIYIINCRNCRKKTSSTNNNKKGKASIQQEPDDGPSKMQTTATGAPPVAKSAANARAEVEKWARRCLDKGVQGLREEFAELKRFLPPDMTSHAFTTHWEQGRNRYKDVPCQDKFRVILKWPGQSHDYIHANYVATPISDKRFICTQVSGFIQQVILLISSFFYISSVRFIYKS